MSFRTSPKGLDEGRRLGVVGGLHLAPRRLGQKPHGAHLDARLLWLLDDVAEDAGDEGDDVSDGRAVESGRPLLLDERL